MPIWRHRHAASAPRSRRHQLRRSCASGGSAFRSRRLLSLLAIGCLFLTVGLNFGIDFRGGTLIEMQAKSGPADIGAIRDDGWPHSTSARSRCRSSATPSDVLDPLRPAAGRRRGAAGGGRQGAGGARRRATTSAASRWSGRACRASCVQTGTLGVAARDARHPDLPLVPLRVAVRGRRDHRDAARRRADHRLLRRRRSSSST